MIKENLRDYMAFDTSLRLYGIRLNFLLFKKSGLVVKFIRKILEKL